ncbi:MAG: SpoIIE family protein phosphatase [Salinivirgaceae bacterium]|nr:SpoIIE family protein phosphatase [Salinivirgaceae bacterium]
MTGIRRICRVWMLIGIMLAAVSVVSAQEKLDSLRIAVASMPDDTAKLSRYDYICNYFYDVDSSGKYSQLMLDLARKLNSPRYLALSYGYRSRYYLWANKYAEALDASVESLNLWDKLDDKFNIALSNMNLAIILTAQGQYESASKYYHISLDAFSEIGDSIRITQVLQNLGNMNAHVRYYQNAIEYFERALTIDSIINNTYGLIADHTGLARVYVNKYKRRRRDSVAEEFLKLSKMHLDTAYALALTVPNIIEMQQLHSYMAMVYIEMAEKLTGKEMEAAIDSCEQHCQRLLKLRHDYNLKSNQSGTLTLLGRAQMRRGNMDKALEYLNRADELEIEEHPRREIKKEILMAFTQYYELKGDCYKANHYLKELSYQLVESSTDEAAARVAQSKSKAEFEHRMRQRALQEYEHEQQYKRQRLLSIVITSSLLVISIIILVSSLRHKKLNRMLRRKNVMLDEKNYQLVAAKEELQSQNELLNVANKSITDSIVYAKHIQEAVIPNKEIMRQIFGECLVMFSPCNIVSGDFYWAVRIGRYKALAVADCTGHGVPGAFMSMLGISMLNDIVANIDMKSQKLKASYLLDNLRDNVRKALRQDNNALSGLDGIDMALVLIDSERQMLQYSGACRPLIMVRNNELTKFDPDRMNIGIYGKDEQFTNHEIEIEPGDCFYAYSDGITDQFCNTGEDQKFGRRRLYEMLLENSTAPFDEQLQTYQRTFEQWRQSDASKAPASQTDDVLLVGIKIA